MDFVNVKEKRIPRMRTIDNAIAEIRQIDPNTDLTKRALQRMIYSGEFPSVMVGKKHLIDLDSLLDFLSGGMYSRSATCVS